MGGSALLKGLWRGGQLQRSLAHRGFNYVSCRAMSSRLFVGGLSFTTEEEGLRTAFSKFGEVVDARIVTDRESGRSRGFGFVTFLAEADAETAKDKLNGQFLDGRVIRVDQAAARPAPPSRVSTPQLDEQPTSQDWGSIPSPIAAVPQNAGLVQTSDLPSLDCLASSSMNTPPSSPFPPSSISPPAETPRPTFNLNLDLSTHNPNFVPRNRPPRIRPSMMDYDFGLFSDTSKFPYNTNFGTGFLKVRGPESEFDFSDIKEAAAIKKAQEEATKQAREAEAMAAKEAAEVAAKQAQEVEAAATNQSQEAMTTVEVPAQTQNTLKADATQVHLSSQTASPEPLQATSSDTPCLSSTETSNVNASELRQVGL